MNFPKVDEMKKAAAVDAHSTALYLFSLCKWVSMGVITGGIIGILGVGFAKALDLANGFRGENRWIICFLPLAGLAIVSLYHITNNANNTGTNLVIASIQSGCRIPGRTAPLIVVSTVLTQLCGGSSGREGAALQLGGSIANYLSEIRFFRFTDDDRRFNIMCGMSAGFAALFGTPMAAAIFALEVVNVGTMRYSALVPCTIAAFTARFVAAYFGIPAEAFTVMTVPTFTPAGMFDFIILGATMGGISILFCSILHGTEQLYKTLFKNQFVRIFVAGCLILAANWAVGNDRYLGSGIGIIEHIFETREAAGNGVFFGKMIFTALTLGAGFKGGEIVPSFCIGAAFGSGLAGVLGMPVELTAACGMVGVFCGVTNCPITSLLIAFEMFGFEGMPYYLLTVGVSYMLSGYQSLYHTQTILHSKIRND